MEASQNPRSGPRASGGLAARNWQRFFAPLLLEKKVVKELLNRCWWIEEAGGWGSVSAGDGISSKVVVPNINTTRRVKNVSEGDENREIRGY